jgi:DNA segregation ATPase FtsK/SpoIIIE, S-DNA-T family
VRIGYRSAATLVKRMEKEVVIWSANAAGKRDILVNMVDEDQATLDSD